MKFVFATMLLLTAGLCGSLPSAAAPFEEDVIETSAGDLRIAFIGHGTLMLTWNEKIIHVDPYGKLADYSRLPEADVVLITHHHGDHLDPEALAQVRGEDTRVILTRESAKKIEGGIVMNNGDVKIIDGFEIEAVPAYNVVHKRDNGEPYHPKGQGNGYVLAFGNTRIYIAGDTENTVEMKDLENIDVAFLPMNLPYTMTPEMVADAAAAMKPRILYPYHFGETDTSRLLALLGDNPDVEVRIRKMK